MTKHKVFAFYLIDNWINNFFDIGKENKIKLTIFFIENVK